MRLRIRDADTHTQIIRRPTGGLFRLCLRRPDPGRGSGASEMRMLLVADLLRRVLEEIHDVPVVTAIADNPHRGWTSAWEHILDALWIPSPAGVGASSDEVVDALGGPADALLECDQTPTTHRRWPAHRPLPLRIGRVTEFREEADGPELVEGHDPLELRLALLAWPHHQSISLTPDRLSGAATTLDRWRHLVATWADHPSRPMPLAVVEQARAALDSDLNVTAVVELMERLTKDPTVPLGAKFETFVHLDRILALELVRYLAHPPA